MNNSLRDYIKILDKYKIPYVSIDLSYDTTNNCKKALHPTGWQKTTFNQRKFNPAKNAIMQIMGENSGVVVIDIDGINNHTNQKFIQLCTQHSKFYNKTKKGYHFFFKWESHLPPAFNVKYKDDPENSGLDFKSTGGGLYYGSYTINNTIIKYENIIHDDILPIPKIILDELNIINNKSNNPKQRKSSNYPHKIINTTTAFPNSIIVDIITLDKLLQCFPPETYTTYNNWFRICYLIKHTNHTPAAFQLFYKYSRSVSQYANISEQECLDKWNKIPFHPTFNFQILLHLARQANHNLFKTIKLPWIDYTDNTLYTPITINSQYINYHTISPYLTNSNPSTDYNTSNTPTILAIKSPYGTGKTQFLANYFNTIATTDSTSNTNPTNILFITSRVSLSYSLLNSFPEFKHYQDKTIDITTQSKLIIQLDSIYKLTTHNSPNKNTIYLGEQENDIIQFLLSHNIHDINPDPDINPNPNINPNHHINTNPDTKLHTKYDIIALDELESLLYHLSFNKLDTNRIFNLLFHICSNASTIIAMDGDFGNRSYIFLKALAQQNKLPTVIHNQYQPPNKHFIFTNNFKSFEQLIDTDLADNLNIVIISMTVKHSEYFYSRIKDKYTTILHNSIQNDRSTLSNINNTWDKTQCLIYTSTIQEGCDFNKTHFHKSYIILSNKSTTPRSLMQMTSRIRKYHNNTTHIYTNGLPFLEFQYPYQLSEVKQYMTSQINTAISNNTNTHRTSNTTTISYSHQQPPPNLLHDILSYNELETLNRNYFITILCELLRSKGHTYEYQRTQKISKPRLANNIYQEIADADNITNDREYQSIIELIKQPNTNAINQRNGYYAIKKYLIAKIWELDIETLITDDIKRWHPKTNKLLNYKFFIQYIQQPNLTNFKHICLANKIKHIQDILLRFNIRHQDDFIYSIDCGTSKQGRTQNLRNNPNLLTTIQYKEITTYIKNTLLTNREFRMLFNLTKLETDISDRKLLEIIKRIINEFGFNILYSRTNVKTKIDGQWTQKIINKYLIDLDEEILDLFNRTSRTFLDDLIDIDDTIYFNDAHDAELENEDEPEEQEIEPTDNKETDNPGNANSDSETDDYNIANIEDNENYSNLNSDNETNEQEIEEVDM